MTKSNKRNLIKQLKRVDKRLNQFVGILCVDFPELKLGMTGSVLFNSYEIDMDESVAKKVLSERAFKKWKILGTHAA